MTEIEELRKELKESQNKQDEINATLLEMLKNLTQTPKTVEVNVPSLKKEYKPKPRKDYSGARQPRPDAMIQIQSLTKGELCLNVNGNVAISFEKYGDIKPVLYSELVNIVNNNRSFAEDGSFYILDDGAVYHLGLGRYYDNIMSFDQIDGIEAYGDDELRDMLSRIPASQKVVISQLLAGKIYHQEYVDMNKVDIISKILDIDIVGKSREMQEVARNMQ